MKIRDQVEIVAMLGIIALGALSLLLVLGIMPMRLLTWLIALVR